MSSKVHKSIEHLHPRSASGPVRIAWSQCVICQSQTSEKPSCPAESKRDTGGAG